MPQSRVASALRLVVIPAVVIVALLTAWQLGYFELDRRQALLELVQRLRVVPWIPVAFVAVFSVAIALCLPANIATLLAGAIFGTWRGAFVSLAGSMLATILAYWMARSVARRPVLRLFGDNRILRNLTEHDGILRLFQLRVTPLAPFAVLSYAAGIAGISIRRLLAATVLGALPGSIAYAFAGAALMRGLVSSSDASKRAYLIAGSVTVAMFVLSLVAGAMHRRHESKLSA